MPPLIQAGKMGNGATILVTGAAGFVGSHMVDLLLAEGWRVIGMDNLDSAYEPARKRGNIAQHLQHSGYRFVHADLAKETSLADLLPEDIHVVVHFAAQTDIDEGVARLSETFDTDTRSTINLLEMCRRRRVTQCVYVSCGSVYGAAPGLPWKEEAIPLPVSPFAAARLASEQMGHCYSRLYGVRFVAARLFDIYGPRDRPTSLMHRLFDALVAARQIGIAGDSLGKRDFTHVSDAVQGVRLAVSFGATPFEVFNIGSGAWMSILDAVGELEAVTGLRAQTRTIALRDGHLIDCAGSIQKARRILGYVPRMSVRDGLQASLDWYMESVARKATKKPSGRPKDPPSSGAVRRPGRRR